MVKKERNHEENENKIAKEIINMLKKRLPLVLLVFMSIVLMYGAPAEAKRETNQVIRGASTKN